MNEVFRTTECAWIVAAAGLIACAEAAPITGSVSTGEETGDLNPDEDNPGSQAGDPPTSGNDTSDPPYDENQNPPPGGESPPPGGENPPPGGETPPPGGGDPMGPFGTSCSDALPYVLEADIDGWVYETISTPGKAVHYSVPLEKGRFYVFSTRANPDAVAGMLDTVVSVWTASGSRLLATADDSYPVSGPDSELIYRAESNGAVCVRVQEYGDWAIGAGWGEPSFMFALSVFMPNLDAQGNATDVEPNDTVETASQGSWGTLEGSATQVARVWGGFGTDSDVDVYRFFVPSNTVASTIYFIPAGTGSQGTSGSGSTTDLGIVSVSDSLGNVVARLDASKGAPSLSLPTVTYSELFLHVNRPDGGALGANDFYHLLHVAADADNPSELEVASGENDTLETAEAFQPGPDPESDSLFVLGYLTEPTDVDLFMFSPVAGDEVSVVCGAVRSGSGLVSPKFEVLDASGTVLREEVETEEAPLEWSSRIRASGAPLVVETTGTHYLRVSAEGLGAEVLGNFYRCGLHVLSL